MRVWNADSGMKRPSSWSTPMAFWPLRSSTPTIVNGASRMRTICPMGSTPGPKRFSAAVWPITALFAALAWSEAVNSAPSATGQLRMVK